ncbi:HNH endonuclease, partial [Dietzia kunjamensis]|nr:HNH endonuclease [Dietzia kunjamensis]
RSVRFRGDRNGMATMWARLTAADAELLRRRIETDASAASADGLDGSLDQLRADALAALAVYPPAGGPSATSPCATDPAAAPASAHDGIELGDIRLGADL